MYADVQVSPRRVSRTVTTYLRSIDRIVLRGGRTVRMDEFGRQEFVTTLAGEMVFTDGSVSFSVDRIVEFRDVDGDKVIVSDGEVFLD